MTPRELFRARIALVQAVLHREGLDGVLLNRVDNFAMATGGKRNHVYTASEAGVCGLFVTREGRTAFVGNTIEHGRLMDEELGGLVDDELTFLWFESSPAEVARKSFAGQLASDDGSLGRNINANLAGARALLTLHELDKYRALGRLAAEAMTATLDVIQPGMPESAIAARLVAEGAARNCLVPVALVAADGRIAKYRHPLPTVEPLIGTAPEPVRVDGYVMVVGCFLREGLVASITRFKQTGELPGGAADAYARVSGVDARMQEATVIGQTLGGVFAECQRAYVDLGFPENEWHNHHQGGATGYAGRTCKGSPNEPFAVLDTQLASEACAILGQDIPFGAAFAWNPSAIGVKSEDTFILLPDNSREIVTPTPSLPELDLEAVLGRRTEAVKSGIAPPA